MLRSTVLDCHTHQEDKKTLLEVVVGGIDEIAIEGPSGEEIGREGPGRNSTQRVTGNGSNDCR